MFGKLHHICAWLLVALGLVHMGFTPFAYRAFTHNALWFVGTGAALIFCGFLNVAWLRNAGRDRVLWLFCLLANVMVCALFAAALFLMREPQVFVGLALSAFALVATVRGK
ncbi:MAG: hypothetical protein H0T63_05410 [Pyrinomonadaceae bacterium]|nr:hypothetical protein [Pyrinomonadaceae bacterium]